MRESTLRKLSETRYAVTLEPDEVREVRDEITKWRAILCRETCDCSFTESEVTDLDAIDVDNHQNDCAFREVQS